MSASVTSGSVSLASPNIFHHYLGPPKSKSNSKTKKPSRTYVDVSPHIPFIDIDDILLNTHAHPDKASGESSEVPEGPLTADAIESDVHIGYDLRDDIDSCGNTFLGETSTAPEDQILVQCARQPGELPAEGAENEFNNTEQQLDDPGCEDGSVCSNVLQQESSLAAEHDDDMPHEGSPAGGGDETCDVPDTESYIGSMETTLSKENEEGLHGSIRDKAPSLCASKRPSADADDMPCGPRSPKRPRSTRQSDDVASWKLRSASKACRDHPARESQSPDGETNEVNVRSLSCEAGYQRPPGPSLHAPFETSLRAHDVQSALTPCSLPSLGEVTITATLNANDSILHLSPTDPAALLRDFFARPERIFDVEDITLKLSGSSGPWQISGRLRLGDAHKDVPAVMDTHTQDAPEGSSAWQLQQRARALCAASARYPTDRSVASGVNAASLDSDNDDYTSEGEEDTAAHRSNERWDPLDEKRLLTWRKEEKEWKWIFRQFPSRTAGAIRTRHHMLLQKERAKSTR